MPNRTIRTIIVDDEELARRGLDIRLREAPDIEIVARCANGREALAAINEHHPDLVFLDIQMPGIDGFEVVRQLPPSSAPLIVFVTAFDQYAIDAFEAEALDYLLKPVSDERLMRAVERARAHLVGREAARQQEKLAQLIARLTDSGQTDVDELLARSGGRPSGQYLDILPVRQGRETVRVPVVKIDWIDAAGDYMCVHAEGRTYVVRGTMKQFESALDPRVFQRVHRSTMVNVDRVRSLRPHTNGEYFLTLDTGHELKLSRSYRDRLEALLGKP